MSRELETARRRRRRPRLKGARPGAGPATRSVGRVLVALLLLLSRQRNQIKNYVFLPFLAIGFFIFDQIAALTGWHSSMQEVARWIAIIILSAYLFPDMAADIVEVINRRARPEIEVSQDSPDDKTDVGKQTGQTGGR